MSADSNHHLSRRAILGLTGAAATSLAIGAASTTAPITPAGARPPFGRLPDGLFALGVASGDPWPDGFVAWTRLAPDPTAPDGLSGMPDSEVRVEWEVSADDSFRRIVRRGVERAERRWAHSVHAEVRGLEPGREYWYRFRVGREVSPAGRAVTAPARDAAVAGLTFAFASCQNYYEGFFTAFGHMARQDVDLVVHLGDYIYEGGGQGEIGRGHLPAAETFSLTDYRIRYGQYKLDADLQAAHLVAPWVVAPDDHDVENNWAGDISQVDTEPDQDPAVFRQRRAAAYQAYWENLPLRRSSMPAGPEMQVFRRLQFGNLMQLDVLDTRRYRDDQIENCPGACAPRWATERQMLGKEQERWLAKGFAESTARWNLLGNQVFCFEADHAAGEEEEYSNDTWDNYAAARQRLFDQVQDNGIDNFVMITGDAHRSTAADLKINFADENSATIGTEFLGTSVTSGGDGSDSDALGKIWLDENPHMKFHNKQRGYQLVRLDHEKLITEYRVCDRVSSADGTVTTRASVAVEAGHPGIAGVD
ncbi:alkaline phosphatase D family protein [Propionibacteriaceae bacterium Y1700]|uniref:alkaline phosphatase D family protein n=1 Tax=Microlunatus sp. Y1700 TaxID=3418487 RepID=UPI003DA759A9